MVFRDASQIEGEALVMVKRTFLALTEFLSMTGFF
jgi:hypothetical protein